MGLGLEENEHVCHMAAASGEAFVVFSPYVSFHLGVLLLSYSLINCIFLNSLSHGSRFIKTEEGVVRN